MIAPEELAGDCSAEAGEVEVDGDGVTFGGRDVNGGGIGGEGFRTEIEFEGCAGQDAWTTASATIGGAAMKVVGSNELARVIDLNLEVSPEVAGARHPRLGGAGPPVRRGWDEPAKSIR